MSDPFRTLTAGELASPHIGSVVSFDWELPTGKTSARVTGELRQIYHTSGDTVLNLCSHTVDTAGSMDEFVLSPGQRVTLED